CRTSFYLNWMSIKALSMADPRRRRFIESSIKVEAEAMDTPKRKLTRREKATRASARAAKLKSARMRSPRELSEILGIGINQAYVALARGDLPGAVRFGTRWLIPDRVIERLDH